MKVWTFVYENTQKNTMTMKIFFLVPVYHLADMPISDLFNPRPRHLLITRLYLGLFRL